MTLVIAFVFFVLGIITLPDYGINWDTINHLPRGQIYLQYFLTKERDFSSLPDFSPYRQDPDTLAIKGDINANQVSSRSLYQLVGLTFNKIVSQDGGHPPLSDILSAVFNRVLFGKLRLINDIDSYRVYGIFLASALVGLVFYWSATVSGFWGGLISSLALSLYPLFWSESHFNTQKDIPETVYWSFFLFAIYRGVTKNSWKWVLFSALFCGLALGTKFNILFSVFVIIPWIAVYLFSNRQKKTIKVWIAFLLVPIIAFLILISTWPYLWQDVVSGITKVFGFYKELGISGTDLGIGKILSFNLYPIKWITFTTPVVTLFFLILGIIISILKIKEDKQKLGLLFLLWFTVPIARVTLAGTIVYGGIRQIMEYIPALALIAGVGGGWLVNFFSKRFKLQQYILGMAAILLFLPITVKLYKIHPNENVYFNFLIGGLEGAKNKNISSWGNSFGAAYRQGVSWINKNAEPGSKLVLAYELMPNIPSLWVRPDILFHNGKRSGFIRDGEYAITLTYDGTAERSYYDRYLETVLEPVYEAKVDSVSILKVWKNDLEHTRKQYQRQIVLKGIMWRFSSGRIEADLGKEVDLSYLNLSFGNSGSCPKLISGAVSLSKDGKNWSYLPGSLPIGQISIFGWQPSESQFIYFFLGEKARYLKIEYLPVESCLRNFINGRVYELPDLSS